MITQELLQEKLDAANKNLDSVKSVIVANGYLIDNDGRVVKDEKIVVLDYEMTWLNAYQDSISYYECKSAIVKFDLNLEDLLSQLESDGDNLILVDEDGVYWSSNESNCVKCLISALKEDFKTRCEPTIKVKSTINSVKIELRNEGVDGWGGFYDGVIWVRYANVNELKSEMTKEYSR